MSIDEESVTDRWVVPAAVGVNERPPPRVVTPEEALIVVRAYLTEAGYLPPGQVIADERLDIAVHRMDDVLAALLAGGFDADRVPEDDGDQAGADVWVAGVEYWARGRYAPPRADQTLWFGVGPS